MFIKCTELNEEENGLVMTSEDNQQRIVLGSGDGEWITAEVDWIISIWSEAQRSAIRIYSL